MTNEQRAQFSREAPSGSFSLEGKPYTYAQWTSAERLAYLDGWAQERIKLTPPRERESVFFKLGQTEARAYAVFEGAS